MRTSGRYGADTGGTFTDVVSAEGSVTKVVSTPADPTAAVVEGLRRLSAGDRPALLAHGTTVATNALLQRRGSQVSLVTNRGLADVIEIARQDRPHLYDSRVRRAEPLVGRPDRHEVGGRLDATGAEIEPLDPEELAELAGSLAGRGLAVAVCLLHSDLNPAHEQAVSAALVGAGAGDVTCSYDVSPEFREYERVVTTAANAYLRPSCRSYLLGLGRLATEVVVMSSAGGLLTVSEAAEVPVNLVLSGPAAGVVAGAAAAVEAGFVDAVTFDMGGTSTDVCLVQDGRPAAAMHRRVAGLDLRVASLDIHTIGAGGGSIAHLDPGGALAVGPLSAGAMPGPACYGRGGTSPTVTDADLVLGRIPAGAELGDLGPLDTDAARDALDRAGVSAGAVCSVVEVNMEQAVRAVTVPRGVDPSGLALVAFGGAGPLHACAVAEALGMAAVVVPPRAGVLSAVGLLCAPPRRDLVRSWPTPRDHRGLDAARLALAEHAVAAVSGEGPVSVTTWVDCRYAGQSHEISVESLDAFAPAHRLRNGYDRPGDPVEVVAVRAVATRPPAVDGLGAPSQRRRPVVGPAAVGEADCTVWVPDGWRADVSAGGSWIIRPASKPTGRAAEEVAR